MRSRKSPCRAVAPCHRVTEEPTVQRTTVAWQTPSQWGCGGGQTAGGSHCNAFHVLRCSTPLRLYVRRTCMHSRLGADPQTKEPCPAEVEAAVALGNGVRPLGSAPELRSAASTPSQVEARATQDMMADGRGTEGIMPCTRTVLICRPSLCCIG